MSASEINPKFDGLIQVYKRFGLWQSEEKSESHKRRWKLFYVFNYVLFLIILVLCAFLSDDEDESLFLLESSLAVLGVHMKMIYILYEKKRILEFLHDFVADSYITDFEEKLHVGQKIKKFQKFANTYLIMIIVTSILSVVSSLPIFYDEKKLPLYITFSCDLKYNVIIYWMAYIFFAWGLALSFIFNSITVIVWYILFKYSIQYQILGEKFKNLGVTTDKKSGKKTFLQDLIGLVKTHRNLCETVERFRICFHNLFLLQIVVSGTYICYTTYVLAFSPSQNVLQIGTSIVFLLYGIADIFLVMYLANEITWMSDRLSYCLFESNWVEQSGLCKKTLIILCEFLKQPQDLVIFKIYPMNLETFTRIMKSAYSMFNILKSFK